MRRSEDGQALLLTLAVLFLLTLLGAAGLTLATGSKQASMGERERLQALYIAEAGVEKALADLKQRLIYPAPGFESFRIANEPYAGGVIEEVYVKKETVGNSVYYTITSVGKYPEEPRPGRLQARKIVKAKVLVGPDPFLAYGGPGPKSDTQVEVKGPIMILGESNIQGSLLARTGDVALESLELEHQGGIYAGGNVRAGRDFTFSGRGEIKAGKDVDLFNASMRTWEGEIWAGNEVYLPPGLPGNVIVHKNCGPRIPGFPLPQFPVVGKGSPWYGRVRKEAQDQGRYFPNAAAWLDDDPEFGTGKGIRWNYSVRLWPKTVLVVVRGAELNLEGITVIDGPLALDAAAYQEAYRRWQERIRSRYPGKTVKFLDADLRKLELRANTAATVVADSIAVD
ncbi:PilX N-terminal domain-containing pilus assembly protein, partial [Thermodesulfitimonas sp.]